LNIAVDGSIFSRKDAKNAKTPLEGGIKEGYPLAIPAIKPLLALLARGLSRVQGSQHPE
jgi:hypothetical protein